MTSSHIHLAFALTVFSLVSTPASCKLVESLVATKENFLVKGHVMQRQQTTNSFSCTHLCLRRKGCLTFNFKLSSKRQGLCELSSETAGYFDDGLTEEAGWQYGQIVRIQKKASAGIDIPAPAECKTWRTKDGGCCVFPFVYQGKRHDSCGFDGQFWCSITENYDIDKMSGVCEDFNFTFTTLGSHGSTGPSDTSGYQETTLQHKVRLENGIQIWQVPLSGSYVIQAWGASGALGKEEASAVTKAGGKGAYMKGTFNLTRGTFLKILVGQAGSNGTYGRSLPGGGGGGTFVTFSSSSPLIVAGGGGGGVAQSGNYNEGDPGQITEGGSQSGGSNGTVGNIPSGSFEGGAGGGFFGDGESPTVAKGGKSFVDGGEGGTSQSGGEGGFGGGGGGMMYPGAGGGYSGGGVKQNGGKTIAGGGGSFNSGANPVKESGLKEGDGKVIITLVDIKLL